MNIHIPRKPLNDALALLSAVAPKAGPNPVLNMLKLTGDADRLTLAATNLDADLEVTLAADVPGEVKALVPVTPFTPFVSSLSSELLELEFSDGVMTVMGGGSTGKCTLGDFNNAFETQHDEAPTLLELEASDLLDALVIRYAASRADYQAIFQGVKFEFSEGLRLVGTDGFRLATYALAGEVDTPVNAVVRARELDALIKVLKATGGTVKLGLNSRGTRLMIDAAPYRLSLATMEGNYPDWQRVIPNQFALECELGCADLLGLLKRLEPFSDRDSNQRIDLHVKDKMLRGFVEGLSGRAEETLELISQEGLEPEINVAYNLRYLRDALTASSSDDLRLSFSGATTPTLVTDSETHFAMIVPLRTG